MKSFHELILHSAMTRWDNLLNPSYPSSLKTNTVVGGEINERAMMARNSIMLKTNILGTYSISL